MAFSWAVQDEDYLMILLENYSPSSYNAEEGVYRNGPMGFFNGAIVVTLDLGKEKVVKEVEIADGKVIYMDRNQYGIMKHEKVEFHRLSTGEVIKEEIINDFEKDKMYYVDNSCYEDELKIYRENVNEVLDTIKIPTVK